MVLAAAVFGLFSCGGPDGPIDTMEKCVAAGGRVVPAPGGPATCNPAEEKIGEFPFGIEGAICCRPRQPPPRYR